MNIEDKLFDNLGELQRDKEGSFFVMLCDAELDPFRVEFHYDETAKIITDELSHLHLTPENLSDIERYIWTTDTLYKKESLTENENNDLTMG